MSTKSLVLSSLIYLSVFQAPQAMALGVLYDAGLGTLPDDQGFTREETVGYPAPSVSSGVLHTFVEANPNTVQFWGTTNFVSDFASSTKYRLDFDLHIVSSNYTTAGGLCCNFQRSGYYVFAEDSAGRSFFIGIASNGITVNTDGNLVVGQGVPFTSFDSTDSFHHYQLVIDSGTGALFIDNVLFASTAVGASGVYPIPNKVSFGEASGLGVSEAELRSLSFAPVPLPAALPLMVSACLIGVARFRRVRPPIAV